MYIVTKKFGRSESRLSDFVKQTDAEKYIKDKLQEDIRFKVNATYGLYEGADLLREFTQSDVAPVAPAASTEGSAQGAGSRSSFAPTPFNTAPRPSGVPHHWVKDEDDKEK